MTANELFEHASYLASDALAGRAVGTDGISEAEKYIAESFERSALSPIPGEVDFFLEFPLYVYPYNFGENAFVIDRNGTSYDFTAGVDFKPFLFSGTGRVDAEVVFAGYGITAPEYGYDDYEGLDAAGKVALVMRHEPRENDPNSPFDGTKHSSHAYFTSKAENAKRHGAVGMLLYTDPLHHAADEDLRLVERYFLEDAGTKPDRNDDGFIALHVSREVAKTILALESEELDELQSAVDSEILPAQLVDGSVTASISIDGKAPARRIAARNVAGFIPGESERWIVISAHHDHIGAFAGEGDVIYNGADDNASGAALVLELAEYYASRTQKLEYGLVLMTFSAEEVGLLGSAALRRYELIDLEKVALMLNFDMIGRNSDDPLTIYGDGYIDGMSNRLNTLASEKSIEIDLMGRRYAGMSDHHNFYLQEIPFLMFHTDEHVDYHGVGDHAEKLDYERMDRIADFAIALIEELSVSGEPLKWK